MSDVLSFLKWYLTLTVIGTLSFPIAYRFFPKLAGKGYGFSKPLGLLLWGYLYWMLNSLGILQNNLGGEIVAFLILVSFSVIALLPNRLPELLHWLKENIRTVLAVEAVFLIFFAGWAVVRAANPDILYTEKPMELAFINSILVSPSFPPLDPWLSGYAISYYYFGYVVIAMLIRVTHVLSGVGYNLTAALWFGMTAAAAFTLVSDLSTLWKQQQESGESNLFSQTSKAFGRIAGILGSFFVLLVSNIEGLLEILHERGVFWSVGADGTLTSRFWQWLAINDLNIAPTSPLTWIPTRNWAWWRGSRVLQDLTAVNNSVEIIDEFPFFSYLLSDLHPHVLAMPFDLMAMGLCLNLFTLGMHGASIEWNVGKWVKTWQFWLTALLLGSMAFFNTWDFPIYIGLFCVVWSYLRIRQLGWSSKRIWEFLGAGLTYGATGFILFLPFFLSFRSQAGGLLPSMEFMTRGVHFWVMFAPLLIPIFIWVIHLWRKTNVAGKWGQGLKFSLALIAILWLVSSFLGLLFFTAGPIGNLWLNSGNGFLADLGQKLVAGANAMASIHGTTDGNATLWLSLQRRLTEPGTWITLTLLLCLVWGLLASSTRHEEETAAESAEQVPAVNSPIQAETFGLILVLMGVGLTLFPEYFYLRDQFGSRMNTIFKFYFQTWMFWGIAAAFASVVLFNQLKKWKNTLFTLFWTVLLLSALIYPVIMLLNKTNSFKPATWTLNGNAYIQTANPDEQLALDWLEKQPLGVISEAVGGSYSEFARVSEQTGDPTVIGWWGHESQWRGGYTEIGSRRQDVQRLYETSTWYEAQAIIAKYDIKYIYVGDLEQSAYQVNTQKFADHLTVLYQNNSVTIYGTTGIQ